MQGTISLLEKQRRDSNAVALAEEELFPSEDAIAQRLSDQATTVGRETTPELGAVIDRELERSTILRAPDEELGARPFNEADPRPREFFVNVTKE